MRTPEELVHSRARLRARYALFPLAGFPPSRLPNFPDAQVRVLAAPALGASFVQYLIDLPCSGSQGEFAPDERVETFYYVLSGNGGFFGERRFEIHPGSFGLLPPGRSMKILAMEPLRLMVLRKRYEPARGVRMFEPHHGNQADVKAEPWSGNPNARLQTLIPDDLHYDVAMNIFTFDSGFGLPYVETHVMEHGLLMLEGKGMYYLEDEWTEVEKDDYIWMAPYCPQCFYATGPTPARYLYYKNINREIAI